MNTQIQETIKTIEEWSKQWKLKLNADKCTTTLFSNDNRDSIWEANIKLNNKRLKTDKTPTFLGITFDRALCFTTHINKIANKIKSRAAILRKLAGTDWGANFQTLRSTYIATGRSCAEYAAAGWAPFISKTSIDKLEMAQRVAGRTISGTLKTSPNDTILIESNLPTIQTRMQQISTIAFDKALRLPANNPRNVAVNNTQRRRIKKTDWRGNTGQAWDNIFQVDRQTVSSIPISNKPWRAINIRFHKAIAKKSKNTTTNKEAADSAIEALGATSNLIAYTDGSAITGNTNGGAGVHIVDKRRRSTINLAFAAGKFTSSYQAEIMAIDHALEVLKDNAMAQDQVLLITDSLSACQHIQDLTEGGRSNNNVELQIINNLELMSTKNILFQVLWVPSHCNITGNDIADKLAEEGNQKEQSSIRWTHETSNAAIKRAT